MLLVTCIGLALASRLDVWPLMLANLLGLLAIVLVIAGLTRVQHKHLILRLIVDFYPIPMILLVFNSLQPLITALGFPNQDANLAAADRLLFAGQDATRVLAEFSRPWLNDLMYLGYLSYFLFPIVVGVAMFRRSPEMGRRFIFTAVLAFYTSYACYFFVPARGPRLVQWPADDVTLRSSLISRTIADFLNGAELTKDDVFPSGHVMIAAVCLISAWRFNRRIFWVMLPIGALLCVSTVYCRYHYAVDTLAGFALACVIQPVGYVIYDRLTGTPKRLA